MSLWLYGKRMLKQKISPIIYDKLLASERELNSYLKYSRYRQPVPRMSLAQVGKDSVSIKENNLQEKRSNDCVKTYIGHYMKLIKEAMVIDSSTGMKICKKILQFLGQFPSMSFLFEVVNSFGKETKRLCLNESFIYSNSNDDVIPFFQKIIERVEHLIKESQSKKLVELGHRIEHLNSLIGAKKHKVKDLTESSDTFKGIQIDRIQKYITLEENLNKAQKVYGNFSPSLLKTKETFSSINRVCMQIKNTQ